MQAIRVHLTECPGCRLEYQSLSDTKRVLASLAHRTSRAEIEALLSLESAGSREGASAAPRGGLLRPRPLAATVLLSVAGLWLASATLDRGPAAGNDYPRSFFPVNTIDAAEMAPGATFVGHGVPVMMAPPMAASTGFPGYVEPSEQTVLVPASVELSSGGGIVVSSVSSTSVMVSMPVVSDVPVRAVTTVSAPPPGIVLGGLSSGGARIGGVTRLRVRTGVILALTAPRLQGTLFLHR